MMFEKRWRRAIAAIGLAIAIASCQTREPSSALTTYNNRRFGFELVYPQAWISEPPPSNLDGRVFRDPRQPDVTILGWAGYELTGDRLSSPAPTNFTTRQGRTGTLTVEVGSQTSAMRLTLVGDRVSYHFEGKAPSQDFANYYGLFYQVASQLSVE
jgi:hypothetical protein